MENFLFSLLTSIFWCSFFFVILHIARKKRYDTRNRNSDVLFSFIFFFSWRIFLPFDIVSPRQSLYLLFSMGSILP